MQAWILVYCQVCLFLMERISVVSLIQEYSGCLVSMEMASLDQLEDRALNHQQLPAHSARLSRILLTEAIKGIACNQRCSGSATSSTTNTSAFSLCTWLLAHQPSADVSCCSKTDTE
jgi:hypothetical protein